MPRSEGEHRELRRLPALLADIFFDGFPGTAVAHRADVVAIGPELAAPELGLHLGQFEAGLGGEGLDVPDDVSSSIFWQELAEDVNVVLVEPDVVDVDGKAFFESAEHVFYGSNHPGHKHRPRSEERR